MTFYHVETDIPVPAITPASSFELERRILTKLKPGESVLLPDREGLRVIVIRCIRTPGQRGVVRRMDGGMRVWCVADAEGEGS